MVKATSLVMVSLVTVVVAAPALALAAPPPGTGAHHTSAPADAVDPPVLQSVIDPESVVLHFDVRPDGTAIARVEYRLPVSDANESAAFDRLQRDIESNSSAYAGRFERRVRDTASNAAAQTGRPMAIENVTVRASVEQLPQARGVVTYSFTWHGFAATEDGRLVVGDALAGLYLGPDMRLLVTWPDGYEPTRIDPTVHEHRDGTAVWVGPQYFGGDGPSVVLEPTGVRAVLRSRWLPVVVVVIGLLALGGGVRWWRSQGGGAMGRLRSSTSEPPPGSEEPTSVDEGGSPAGAGSDADEPRAGVATAPGKDTADASELLSNEEQVIELVERYDGRVKQQTVVEALGWSEAKVSRVVGRLRDEERLETFRIGNENVLTLPGEGLS